MITNEITEVLNDLKLKHFLLKAKAREVQIQSFIISAQKAVTPEVENRILDENHPLKTSPSHLRI